MNIIPYSPGIPVTFLYGAIHGNISAYTPSSQPEGYEKDLENCKNAGF